MVGNADINRRVVIRAYAPCLAWKTIFHAGDNSCRLVCLTLARSLALSLHPSPLPFPFLSSSHLGPTLSPRLSRFHPPFSPPLPRSRYTRGPKGGPRETSARYLIAVGPSHATPRHERTNYTSHVSAPLVLPARVALVHVYQGGGGLNWSRSGLSSNKCLAISDIRQPDTSNLYVWGPGHGPHVYLGEKIIWMFR